MLQNVSSELFQVLPDVSSELNNVADTVQETLHAAKITADAEDLIPVGKENGGRRRNTQRSFQFHGAENL